MPNELNGIVAHKVQTNWEWQIPYDIDIARCECKTKKVSVRLILHTTEHTGKQKSRNWETH